MTWAEGIAGVDFFLTVAIGSLTTFLASSSVNNPVFIPATTRLFLMQAAKLIITLSRSFKDVAERRIRQPEHSDVLAVARAYRNFTAAVHNTLGSQCPSETSLQDMRLANIQDLSDHRRRMKGQNKGGARPERPKK